MTYRLHFAVFSLAVFFSATADAEPLRCTFVDDTDGIDMLVCDVTEDQLNVTDVEFNRGNCPSPVMTDDERAILAEVEKEVPREKIVETLSNPFMLFALAGVNLSGEEATKAQIKSTFPSSASAEDTLAALIKFVYTDPTGKNWKFGDRFTIKMGNECPNLLEAVIDTDHGVYKLER